jgi:flavin-dependent dehydrogenase
MNEFDVVVVGGGPAGAAAATMCARRGLSVALIEHKKFPRHKVCGDVINPNCWPVLERLGVAEKIRALPQQRLSGARFTTPSGAALEVPLAARAIRRSLFDDALLTHARARGVTVFENETVHDVTPERAVVTRRATYFPVKGIIGADGRHSPVAKRTRLESTGARRNGAIAFQGHFCAPTTMDDRVQLHLFAGGYSGVVRVDAGCVNLCIVTKRDLAAAHEDCEALFARTVWQNPQFRALGIAPEPLEPLASAHPLRTAMNVPCAERVWLAGDALRATEPFTGQGIFFALRSAELAAAAVCDGADYAQAVRRLYRERARTNELLWRLMYRDRVATRAIATFERFPLARRWLAANVLAA